MDSQLSACWKPLKQGGSVTLLVEFEGGRKNIETGKYKIWDLKTCSVTPIAGFLLVVRRLTGIPLISEKFLSVDSQGVPL